MKFAFSISIVLGLRKLLLNLNNETLGIKSILTGGPGKPGGPICPSGPLGPSGPGSPLGPGLP